MTAATDAYFILRAAILVVGLLLGLLILTAFVWVPFYGGEGYTLQFQDRIFQLIGQVVFFLMIIIPYRWTVTTPLYQFRLGLIVVAAAWACAVDVIAYDRGLTNQHFTLGSTLAVAVAILLCVTLGMHRNRWKSASP